MRILGAVVLIFLLAVFYTGQYFGLRRTIALQLCVTSTRGTYRNPFIACGRTSWRLSYLVSFGPEYPKRRHPGQPLAINNECVR